MIQIIDLGNNRLEGNCYDARFIVYLIYLTKHNKNFNFCTAHLLV